MPPERGNPARPPEWSPDAWDSFLASIAYISEDDPPSAERVKDRVRHALAQLVAFPGLGTPTARRGERRFAIPKTGHVVNYRVTDQGIRILLWYRARQNVKR